MPKDAIKLILIQGSPDNVDSKFQIKMDDQTQVA